MRGAQRALSNMRPRNGLGGLAPRPFAFWSFAAHRGVWRSGDPPVNLARAVSLDEWLMRSTLRRRSSIRGVSSPGDSGLAASAVRDVRYVPLPLRVAEVVHTGADLVAQLGEVAPGDHRSQPDRLVAAGRHEDLPARSERDGVDGSRVAGERRAERRTAADVPQPDGPVHAGGCERAPVGA